VDIMSGVDGHTVLVAVCDISLDHLPAPASRMSAIECASCCSYAKLLSARTHMGLKVKLVNRAFERIQQRTLDGDRQPASRAHSCK
jgi:hypothetical protein